MATVQCNDHLHCRTKQYTSIRLGVEETELKLGVIRSFL